MPGTVSVYCKIPNGIILRAFMPNSEKELMQGGAKRDITVYRNKGEPIRIAGPGRLDRGMSGASIVSGFAVTHNVDAETWENWYAANKESSYVRHGLIFAHAKPNDGAAEAREKRDERSGLEPIDPQGDPRSPKKRSRTKAGDVGVLETAAR